MWLICYYSRIEKTIVLGGGKNAFESSGSVSTVVPITTTAGKFHRVPREYNPPPGKTNRSSLLPWDPHRPRPHHHPDK